MKALRIAASVAIATTLAVGVSACGFFVEQATEIHYAGGNGASGSTGDIDIRNTVLISDNGVDGNLLVSFVNGGDADQDVTIQYSDAQGTKVDLVAQLAVTDQPQNFGQDPDTMITVADVDAAPGTLFPIFFQSGTAEGVELLVPVLSTEFPQYTAVPLPSSDVTAIPRDDTVTEPAEGTEEHAEDEH